MTSESRGIIGFLYETGLLKRCPRTGWWLAASGPERSPSTPSAPASSPGSSRAWKAPTISARVSGRARLPGNPYHRPAAPDQRYVTATANEQVTSEQVRRLPPAIASMIGSAVTEYETGETLEARCARDADKLECLLQAREYEDQGHRNVQPWIDSSIASLHTPAAKQLAHEALAQNSLDWLQRARQTPQQDTT